MIKIHADMARSLPASDHPLRCPVAGDASPRPLNLRTILRGNIRSPLNNAPRSCTFTDRMSGTFRRQLAEYASYHRDKRNCLMHIIGNPVLFMAAVLPLSLLSVTILGVEISVAALLVVPA